MVKSFFKDLFHGVREIIQEWDMNWTRPICHATLLHMRARVFYSAILRRDASDAAEQEAVIIKAKKGV